MNFLFGKLAMSDTFQELLSNFITGIPKILSALLILVIGLIVSKFIEKFTKKSIKVMGIDAFGDKLNEIEIVDKSNIKIKISTVISKILYYFILLFFLVVATSVLNMAPVSELVIGIFNFIPKIIVALIILIFGILLADGLKTIIQTACNSLNIPSGKLIANFVFYFLFINILVSALAQTGINTDFLSNNISILIGGIVLAFAIGYGLATKSTMSNFLASFYSKNKFEKGDQVTFDGVTGKIVDIDNSSIVIATERSKVIIPLSKMTEEKIEIHN